MELLLARDGAVLQKELLSRIAPILKDDRRQGVLMVPSQASFLMESQLMQQLHVSGFSNVQVWSFEKLSGQVLSRLGGRAIPQLGKNGMAMQIRQLMAKHGEKLPLFNGENDAALHQKLADLIAACMMEAIFPETLEQLAAQTQGGTKEKLLQIAFLYRALQKETVGRFCLPPEMESYARNKISQSALFQETEFFFWGFDVLPKARIETVLLLAKQAKSLLLAMEADAQDAVFEKQNRNLKMLKKMAQEAGVPLQESHCHGATGLPEEIQFLADALFCRPWRPFSKKAAAIGVTQCQTPREEVRCAAEKILEYRQEKGVPLEEMQMILASPGEYAGAVSDIFSAWGIPFFFESKRSLQKSRLGVFFESGMDVLLQHWPKKEVLRHLKTGFLPLSQEEMDCLMTAQKEKGIFGSAWKAGFPPKWGEELEEMRRRAFSPLLAAEAMLKEGATLASAMLAYGKALDIAAQLEGQAQELQHQFAPEARFLEQLWQKAETVLSEAHAFSTNVPLAQQRDMICAGLAGAEIAIVPPMVHQVVLGDVTHSIFPQKRVLFLLGANDGWLPAPPEEGGVLHGRETEELRRALPNFPDRLNFQDQKYYIRRTLSGGQRLEIFFHRQGPPSGVLRRVLALFPGVSVAQGEEMLLRSCRGVEFDLAKEVRAAAGGAAPGWRMAAFEKENPALLQKLRRVSQPQPPALSPETAQRLYGEIRGSVSRMESFYTCPYRHFLQYGIGPVEPEEYGEDARQAGIYVHSVLNRVSKTLAKANRSFGQTEDEELEKMVQKAAAEEMQEHNGGVLAEKRFSAAQSWLQEEIALAAKAIKRQMQGKESYAEQWFGTSNALSLETPMGRISVSGAIDRMDVSNENGQRQVQVVDYKTGKKEFSLKEMQDGVNLQLVVYLAAAVDWLQQQGKAAAPKGAFYFQIALPYLEPGEKEEDRFAKLHVSGFSLSEEKAKGICRLSPDALADKIKETYALIANAGQRIWQGEIAPAPYEKAGQPACISCPYQGVCCFDAQEKGDEDA